jgi:ABC-type branched-subunit amino acid transport system ATPase component
MISSVKIKNYRAFANFEMANLGRVNLLVGRNNTGKTFILEGLFMLASRNNPTALWQVLARRGEQVMPEPQPNRGVQAEADICHLFHGHDIGPGTELSISTTNDKPGRSVKYKIDVAKPEENPQLFAHLADEGLVGPRLALWISGTPEYMMPPIPISALGSLRFDTLQQYINLRPPRGEGGIAQFITTESLSIGQIIQLWNAIVLTPDEERVTRALQILEKDVERIAQVQIGPMQLLGAGYTFPNRGGFFVRLAGNDKRIPIGSFGDGMWRMLALAVALVRAKDSILLVDEIDTGLHYTVMADMWRLVREAAELFNVQVFATTHSYDCVHSLAKICREVDDAESAITIQRIESNHKKAIPYTEADIRVAAERNIEMR